MLSNKAFKFDHETAQASVKELCDDTDAPRSLKLAFLYGARYMAIHGDIPPDCLRELDALIRYYERNRDNETQLAERFEWGERSGLLQ